MKRALGKGLFIILVSGWIVSCTPRKQIVDTYSRPLNETELQAELKKRDAELVFQTQAQTSTFVVLDTPERIQYGSLEVQTYEASDNTTHSSINHSLYGVASNPNAKVDIVQGATQLQSPQGTSSQKFIIAIVRDDALQRSLHNFRLTFRDNSQTIVPANRQTGLYFSYDSLEKEEVSSLELLSVSGEPIISLKL